jgi:hypothetical protein
VDQVVQLEDEFLYILPEPKDLERLPIRSQAYLKEIKSNG